MDTLTTELRSEWVRRSGILRTARKLFDGTVFALAPEDRGDGK